MAFLSRNKKKIVDTTLPKCDLYYRQGTSDKEYHLEIKEEKGGGCYTVHFAYGRRGGTLNYGTKAERVAFLHAQLVFDKMRNEKLAKGYTEVGSGVITTKPSFPDREVTRITLPPKARAVDALYPKLCLPSEAKPEFLIEQVRAGTVSWVMQEKLDGKRILLRVRPEKAPEVFNKTGGYTSMPHEIVKEIIENISSHITLDGELIGGTYHVFDLLEHMGRDWTEFGLMDRLLELDAMTAEDLGHVKITPSWSDPYYMDIRLKELRRDRKEGVVFKLLDSLYVPGRTAEWLKCKFWESVTVLVVYNDRPDKRSIKMQMFRDLGSSYSPVGVDVGYCTIPPSKPVPLPGEFAEIKYLYVSPGSTSLYQPQYIGPRDDVGIVDCDFSGVKFKGE